MSPQQGFLLGGLLVLICALTFNLSQPASALGNGPYELMRHSNPTANAGVFRIDTSTGNVSYCYVSSTGELACSREVK